MANCCSSRVGRSPHVAAIQTYSDFAPIEELPVIQSLRESVCERADFLDPSHEAQLQTLLQRLVPGTTFDKDFDWRALGFQSANCRTDFRGSGLSGLRCLNHLAEHYPDEYRRYIAHSNIDSKLKPLHENWCRRSRISLTVCLSVCVSVCVLNVLCRWWDAGCCELPVQRKRACNGSCTREPLEVEPPPPVNEPRLRN